jgi:diphthine-ammonia ligase
VKPPTAISWSGGKDSCLALMRASASYDVRVMVTMFDESIARSRSHGLRPEMIAAHAVRLGLESITAGCSWATYDRAFHQSLMRVAEAGCTHVIFGDIFEDSHRTWTERMCAGVGLTAVQPIFGEPTGALVREFLDGGGVAKLVTVRAEHLDAAFLGLPLTHDLVARFEARGIDPCGERGEYHTLVTDCVLFSSPIDVHEGERVFRDGCWAIDLLPQAAHAAM